MATLEQALDTASQLPLEQQEMLAEILRQRQNAAWRRQAATDACESIAAFHEGRFPAESADMVIAQLRTGLTSPEGE